MIVVNYIRMMMIVPITTPAFCLCREESFPCPSSQMRLVSLLERTLNLMVFIRTSTITIPIGLNSMTMNTSVIIIRKKGDSMRMPTMYVMEMIVVVLETITTMEIMMDCKAWASTREPSLSAMNEMFSVCQYCTPCFDYPSYQDGYLIGDYGTDEEDLIIQCWKFYSHDSYPCSGECINMGHSQGSILLEVEVGGYVFGLWDGERKCRTGKSHHIKASLFCNFAAIVFVLTDLHIVRQKARRVRGKKSQTLLNADKRRRARSPPRSMSSSPRSKRMGMANGLQEGLASGSFRPLAMRKVHSQHVRRPMLEPLLKQQSMKWRKVLKVNHFVINSFQAHFLTLDIHLDRLPDIDRLLTNADYLLTA